MKNNKFFIGLILLPILLTVGKESKKGTYTYTDDDSFHGGATGILQIIIRQ